MALHSATHGAPTRDLKEEGCCSVVALCTMSHCRDKQIISRRIFITMLRYCFVTPSYVWKNFDIFGKFFLFNLGFLASQNHQVLKVLRHRDSVSRRVPKSLMSELIRECCGVDFRIQTRHKRQNHLLSLLYLGSFLYFFSF